ncbi:response regulator transcription factor [Sediminibacterium sp.]|jgi:two-component system invasion response regulator UvrY|uniref:response regulator transcription factor n=1 Tax=Sediminibacterium sp. TaxID=1917865 RepID=UPI001B3D5EB2|nr:response regulator transcription factor [Sediminibacterium sp.]MBP7345857.1 response regulator transcription factor [Sediminibacterium sp.]MDO8995219.1 response regulator transcription factor [Sediminibacterium sp.]MDO9156884.1 response regulator transcription factor [Sediminibacterium sp.]MDP1972359.1 response regulator transcription factor [Sediminibacterium sp.]MDP2422434.1 response regulator transcription factor [Sediminibacterium sp.]
MKTTVALVDDHELLRSGLAAIINSFGEFEVVLEAGNGLEFIKKVKAITPPDIVLLDITMPEMDGYETAAWIRKHLPTVKVLVLSMLSNDLAIIRMLRNGVKGYIIKDSKPHVFKEAMESIQKNEFFVNELVRDKLINYVSNEEDDGKQTALLLSISEQEAHFLQLVCADKSYKEIADEMFVSVRTIDNYRDNLFKKLETKSRVGLVLFAIRQGIANIYE